MTNFEGWQFDQYKLDWLVGQGGFADVYRAWDCNLKRRVAIKILHNSLTNEVLEKFCEEARIMAHLRHPHIITAYAFNFVRVHELNRYRKLPYLVMEYAPNGSLAQRHPLGEKLHMDTIMHYLEQIVDALTYIHDYRLNNRRLVHQDIKPTNILLSANDEILISDFGIAKFAKNMPPQPLSTTKKDWVGTAIYMAPEQFRGHSNPATDQYALGIILYRWLTGRYPFYGTNIAIMQQQLHAPPPSLRSISPDILPSVEQAVLKALRKNPYSRFKNERELLSALEEACHPSFPRSLVAFLRASY